MTIQQEINENPWRHLNNLLRRRLALVQIGANLIGALIVTCYFVFIEEPPAAGEIRATFAVLAIMFPGLVILASVVLRIWQKDLNRFFRLKAQHRRVKLELTRRAQRKILDMPYVSAMMSLFNWLLAAIIMSLNTGMLSSSENTLAAILFEASRTFTGVIIAGGVTCAIIFFSIEIICRRVWPLFFPEGGMVQSPCTFRLRLSVRMFIIFALASLLPIILMAVLSFNKAKMMLEMNPQDVIQSLLNMTAFLLATTLGIAIILSRLFSAAIIRPVGRMEQAMAKIAKGDLTVSVPVENNDELGALSDHFNRMTAGLRERYELRRSLDLAREVQQSLLPAANPAVEGLDVAGKSIYCDETGGDYFDFLKKEEGGHDKLAVVIGDVSEHGIPSALLMATARAFIRQRSALSGSIASVVSDVNQQLTRDVEDTGRFVTLFYLLIDLRRRQLRWVRAGHDPAILYEPQTDRFEELGGEGLAMGVNENWNYQEYEKSGLCGGQIVLLGTDGLWEAQNPDGEMFGKEPIYEIIRRHASADAQHILDAVIEELTRFQKSMQCTDDITLIVIKVDRRF